MNPTDAFRQGAIQAIRGMGAAGQSAVPTLRKILKNPLLSCHWGDTFEALREIDPDALEPIPRLIEQLRIPISMLEIARFHFGATRL